MNMPSGSADTGINQISTCPAVGVEVIRLHGRVDLSTSAMWGSVLDSGVALGRRLLVVDLASVTFMDCVGVALILRTFRRLAPGAHLALCGIPDHLRLLFEISGVISANKINQKLANRVFLFPDTASALSSPME